MEAHTATRTGSRSTIRLATSLGIKPIPEDQHVGTLDIPITDAIRMKICERLGDLDHEPLESRDVAVLPSHELMKSCFGERHDDVHRVSGILLKVRRISFVRNAIRDGQWSYDVGVLASLQEVNLLQVDSSNDVALGPSYQELLDGILNSITFDLKYSAIRTGLDDFLIRVHLDLDQMKSASFI